MVAQMQAFADPREGRADTLLRRGLIGNAIFSAISGAVMIVGSGQVSDFTGLTPGWVPAAIGAGVLLWALDVGWIARRDEIKPSQAWFVIGGDLLWVVTSFAIILAGVPELTAAGKWTVGILAEIVGVFAVVQYLGLRRLRA